MRLQKDFYGMKSILLVFMTTFLVQPDGGLDTFSIKEAEAWNHLFVASAYFFPIVGGILADAFLGKYLTIIILSLVYCLGHASLALMGYSGDTRMWLFAGLALIAIDQGELSPVFHPMSAINFPQGIRICSQRYLDGFIFPLTLVLSCLVY